MKILLWGNSVGVESYLTGVGPEGIAGIVAAANRKDDLANVAMLAAERSIPFHVQPFSRYRVEYRAFLKAISSYRADIYLVNAYSMILDEVILSYPGIGSFNVHGGLLPQYRGANVLNWVLINGEAETGVTVHYMDEGVDTGDIVKQCRIPIDIDDTAVTLREKILKTSGDMLIELMPELAAEKNSRIKQDEKAARYWGPRRPKDGYFEWGWPAAKIYNLIRALVKPWPGAFYIDRNGRKVVIDNFLPLKEVKEEQKKQIGHVIE